MISAAVFAAAVTSLAAADMTAAARQLSAGAAVTNGVHAFRTTKQDVAGLDTLKNVSVAPDRAMQQVTAVSATGAGVLLRSPNSSAAALTNPLSFDGPVELDRFSDHRSSNLGPH